MELTAVKKEIEQKEWVLLYFKNNTCSVCGVLRSKVEDLLTHYPKINLVVIDTDQFPDTAAHFNIYSAPAMLLFINGKDFIREAGIISVSNFEHKLSRLYELFKA